VMARPAKYPWRTMAVGESFFAAGRTPTSIHGDVRKYHRPLRVRARSVMINGIRGVRVWRIA
jgi:hypothetical protein